MKKIVIKLVSVSIVYIMLFQLAVLPFTTYAEETAGTKTIGASSNIKTNALSGDLMTYTAYLNQHKQKYISTNLTIPIKIDNYLECSSNVQLVGQYEGADIAIKFLENDGYAIFKIDVPETGLYQMRINFLPFIGTYSYAKSILGIKIDEKTLFQGMDGINLDRPWRNVGKYTTDSRGNQIQAEQIECQDWTTQTLNDSDGRQKEPLNFYLEKGVHSVRISCPQGNIAIREFIIYQGGNTLPYSEITKQYESSGYKTTSDYSNYIQAEGYSKKSDSMITTEFDKSDPATQPNDPVKIILNTITGNTYKKSSQWVEWEVKVPKAGLYVIDIRARQNFKSGFFSTRRLTIDGEIPFSECEDIRFGYSNKWNIKNLGNNDGNYLFYLNQGSHTLRLESVAGVFGDISIAMDDSIYRLNSVYNSVVMVAGTEPDIYRDYQLNLEVPELSNEIKSLLSALVEQERAIIKTSGKAGSELASIRSLINMLSIFDHDLDKIPALLESFRANIESLAAWSLKLTDQPLDLDYIYLSSPDLKTPKATASFFEKLFFDVTRLIASYQKDYGMIGDYNKGPDEGITVWLELGRDQLKLIKNLVDNKFSAKSSTRVKLAITPSSLTEAVLAGKGPDISLYTSSDMPVTLASRNALVDLSKFDTFKEVEKRYVKGTMTPFMYRDGCYAIPITESFPMMFVRTDILKKLNLSVPNNWDEMYRILAVLQRKNMDFGVPTTFGTFATLIFQNGGELFTENKDATLLSQPAAISAFKTWTDFYAKYSFPVSYDFYNRFRSGQMPIGIADYSLYCMLQEAAPEIRNQWKMFPIPGVLQKDGTVNRTISISNNGGTSSSSGLTQSLATAVILRTSKNKEASWEFIDWFTSTDIQTRFGQGIEAVLGKSGRYSPANVEAFKLLSWTKEEKDILLDSWSNVKTINEIPGNYYITRYMNTAFRKVIYNNDNPVDTLNKYNIFINKEISRKRIEYNLNVE